jgi:hypothetical protein
VLVLLAAGATTRPETREARGQPRGRGAQAQWSIHTTGATWREEGGAVGLSSFIINSRPEERQARLRSWDPSNGDGGDDY